MKKNILFSLIIMILICTIFGCTDEPMFWSVEQEIELDVAIVTGNVYSMTQFNNKIYAATGSLWVKDSSIDTIGDARRWTKSSRPNDLTIIRLGIGDNGNSLYTMSIQGHTEDEEEPGTYHLHFLNTSGTWTDVTLPTNAAVKELISDGTNAYAVLNSDNATDVVYSLSNGTLSETENTASGGEKSLETASKFQGVASCNGTTYFHTTPYITTNYDKTITYVVTSGTIYYSATPIDAPSSSNANWTSCSNDDFNTPYSMTYYEFDDDSDGTMEYGEKRILVGTSTGYFEIPLNADGTAPTSPERKTPNNNYATTFGTHEVICLYAPKIDTGIGKGSIYAGTLEKDSDDYGSKYSALWGYYPTRATWNCE